jgi:hypothetical protein
MNDKTEGGPLAVVPSQEREERELIIEGPGKAVEIRSAFDIKPSSFKAGLERRGKNRDALMAWIRDALVEGTDWGRIHVVKKESCDKGKYCDNPYHFSKPSLWKAGAEKIAGMMGLRATWPNLDDELNALRGGGNMILLKCQLLDMAGNTVSEGVGARGLKQDYDDPNKALKMAKKSSLIDAVLNAGGLSEVFTQDVEDMPPDQFPEGGSDPYQKGEDRVDHALPRGNVNPVSTHCPIGREWKGVPWTEVDSGFLEWILMKIDDKPDMQTRLDKPVKTMAEFAREITNAQTVDQLTVIRDDLANYPELEPGLRGYLAGREKELNP